MEIKTTLTFEIPTAKLLRLYPRDITSTAQKDVITYSSIYPKIMVLGSPRIRFTLIKHHRPTINRFMNIVTFKKWSRRGGIV